MGQGAYIFGCAGPVLSDAEKTFFATAQPWGFILFARNVESPDQLRQLTGDLRASVGWNAPILVDQEGGRVQRMRAPDWREWLPPLDQTCATPTDAARAMWLRYRIIADELRAVGIDSNCAPTADIAHPDTHPFLRNRCYGETAETVTELSRAVADGLLAGGVLPVIKHIPGHGRSVADSHKDLPHVDAPVADLVTSDFVPFTALNDLPLAMTAHLVYTAIDNQVATMSRPVISLIRDQIGYDGLLMCDDVSMGALSGTVSEKCDRSLAAGCDVILHCNGELDEMQGVVDACGNMSVAAQTRADRALLARRDPEPLNMADAEAEFASLVGGAGLV